MSFEMNVSLIRLEMAVLLAGLAVLLLDLWLPAARRRPLGYGAALALLGILLLSFTLDGTRPAEAFGGMYVLDALALFFKRLFLLAGALVMVLAVEFADRIETGLSEFYALILFALSGMMFAASANDFSMLFVSIELIAVTFYVLTSFQRSRRSSLEAGVKYLILGAVASALMVYGIALVYGAAGTMRFDVLGVRTAQVSGQPLFLVGLLLVFLGLAFKIGTFPMQVWVPDVYQGAPTPVTAFLAVGSKAAGVVLLLRLYFGVVVDVTLSWEFVFMALSALTILYGNLCALPQRNLKRLLGYSSIAHAGYLLLGAAAATASGSMAMLYYLAGYLFTVVAAFTVIAVVIRQSGAEDISALAGLHRRSPLLAATMTMAMVSLAGVPPLAGFFGKFLLLRAVAERAAMLPSYYWLLGVAIFGMVVSLWYYFGVIRAMFWSKEPASEEPIHVSLPARVSLGICIAGMLYLGLLPGATVHLATEAVRVLKF